MTGLRTAALICLAMLLGALAAPPAWATKVPGCRTGLVEVDFAAPPQRVAAFEAALRAYGRGADRGYAVWGPGRSQVTVGAGVKVEVSLEPGKGYAWIAWPEPECRGRLSPRASSPGGASWSPWRGRASRRSGARPSS